MASLMHYIHTRHSFSDFIFQLFETTMMFLLDVEDDPLWHGADNDQHEEEGSGDRCGDV